MKLDHHAQPATVASKPTDVAGQEILPGVPRKLRLILKYWLTQKNKGARDIKGI